MSSTNIEQVMPVKLALALANPIFPALDSQLRAGRHIGIEELDNHAFLMDYQPFLEEFYARYNVELIRAPEGFFYLRPRSTTLIPRSVLSELDMMVGKILCYLYLVNQRSTGSDLDRAKLQEKMRASLSRLRRLGMVWFMGNDSSKFRIMESVFRFGADVRSGDDAREAQLRLIRDGEAMTLENAPVASESDEAENDSEHDASERAEDEQA